MASSRGESPLSGIVRLLKAFAQLVTRGLRSGISSFRSGEAMSGADVEAGEGVEDEEGVEEDCRRELRISVERESRAGCKYPSNQRLKQES
jgi:hypothetical protein